MKVGILTFHRAENFGAALQVYALQTYLRSIKYDAFVIDYWCKSIERQYQIFNPSILVSRKNIFRSMSLYLERFKTLSQRIIKKSKFRKFRDEYLFLTDRIKDIKQFSEFDAIIVGSDQVWRLSATNNDMIFFLNFKLRKGVKRIAYAASSEFISYNSLVSNQSIIRALDKFDNISVREQQLKDLLQPYLKEDIFIALDPTFLLSDIEYESLAIKPCSEGYVLVYHLFQTKEGVELAERIAQEKGLKVIEIHAEYGYWGNPIRHIQTAGPRELLGYILYADTVITTSFHGLAMSLILKKNVWVIDKGANTRLKNLLDICGLQNRLICDMDSWEDSDIDYVEVNRLLQPQIEKSKKYLKESLSK